MRVWVAQPASMMSEEGRLSEAVCEGQAQRMDQASCHRRATWSRVATECSRIEEGKMMFLNLWWDTAALGSHKFKGWRAGMKILGSKPPGY